MYFDPERYADYRLDRNGTLVPYDPSARLSKANGFSLNLNSPNLHWGSFNLRYQWRETGIFPEASEGREVRWSDGSSLDGERTLTFRNLTMQSGGFFVKLAYQFRG